MNQNYNSHSSQKKKPISSKPQYQQRQSEAGSDDQLSSILYSESQYSNKKPSKMKVYQTPEKKYDHFTQKKMQMQAAHIQNKQDNAIFAFNQYPLKQDKAPQNAGEYKWHLPQRQPQQQQQFQQAQLAQNGKKQISLSNYQQDQNNNGGAEDQHSFIPSDNSSNIFDSQKSFAQSLNYSNNYQSNSPYHRDQQIQHFKQGVNQGNNTKNNNTDHQTKGITQSSSEDMLDSTDQIIKNMRADLLQVDYNMKQIIPHSNVQVVYEEDQQLEDASSQGLAQQNQYQYLHENQHDNGFMYSNSQPHSPSDQQPLEIGQRSQRESFNDISNQQLPINQQQYYTLQQLQLQQQYEEHQQQQQQQQQQLLQQQQYQQQQEQQQQLQSSEQSVRNQENNPNQHPYYLTQKKNQPSSRSSNYEQYNQSSSKRKNDDPIVRDIIQNIEASKKYLSLAQKYTNQAQDQQKQLHIYESILDENKNRKKQKQLSNTKTQMSNSHQKLSSSKKQPHYSVAVLESIQKKRSISLQNSDVKRGKKYAQSPQKVLLSNLSEGNFADYSYSPPSYDGDNKKSSIESKISLLKDLTYRHIQTLPLTSHLSSLKKQSQSPNSKKLGRTGFEVCTFLKDPSGKSLVRPKSKEQIIQENLQKPIVGSADKKSRLSLEMSVAKEKKQSEVQTQSQMDDVILKLNEDLKNVSQLILQTDSKVNRLEIKNKKLKQKWADQGLNNQILKEQESNLQSLRAQEQKNSFILSELSRCNSEMNSQIQSILQQIEMEKQLKGYSQRTDKKANRLSSTLVKEDSHIHQLKLLDNVTSPNNTLSLPSSPYTFIGGSFSVKNQLQQNKNINAQFQQQIKSDESLNNIMGSSFDQQEQMISHLIQKYSPSPKKQQTQPSSSNQTLPSSSSGKSENKNKSQNVTQYKNMLQARGLHDIMEEPSCDESKVSFLPLTHYQK